MKHPFIIGLTGGVASGKSTISRLFARLGAKIINADEIGHEILSEEQIKNQIRDYWGEKVFRKGEIDRDSLARIVFDPADNRKQLTKLEGITHPRIRERIGEEIQEATSLKSPAVVLDIPLLFEADWHKICQRIVFVDVAEGVRLERAKARGWTTEHWEQRENQQMSIAEKRRMSSDIVDNTNDIDATFQQIQSLWSDWGLQIPPDSSDQPNHF